ATWPVGSFRPRNSPAISIHPPQSSGGPCRAFQQLVSESIPANCLAACRLRDYTSQDLSQPFIRPA
ncbi:MAG: hypothetical protein ACKO3P_02585, partial [Planctomycetaceae bacterium]